MRQLIRDSESFCTLGIETSCDETGLCLLRGGREIRAEVLARSDRRARPLRRGDSRDGLPKASGDLSPPFFRSSCTGEVSRNPAKEIDLIAVTRGPGLMGALLVGVMSAKGLAQGWSLPLLGVNHLEGHIFANVLHDPRLEPPFLNLVVSGGHTEIYFVREYGSYELLGRTRDDAAGRPTIRWPRCWISAIPGGPKVDALASRGNPEAFDLPVPLGNSSEIAFSFSGLKTAVLWKIEALKKEGISPFPLEDLCASFQKAAVASLTGKVRLAMKQTVSLGWRSPEGWRQTGVFARGLRRFLEERSISPPWRSAQIMPP